MLIYNAGYLEGRDLPPEKELLEYVPVEMLDTGLHISARGPFLVAQEVLPAMRKNGRGSFFFSNNSSSLRGKKRMTGQSLYYPRVLMRTLAQVLTEDYSEHGVHVANIVIDGSIDSPGSRKLPRNQNRREFIINPVKIAEAYWYLHTQDKSCWTHELQLTPFADQAELLTARRGFLQPKRFERGKPLGTRRPAPPRPPSQGVRSISVRVRFSPCRHERPSARRNTLASARPPAL